MNERELDTLIDAGLDSYGAPSGAGLATRIVSECSATPALVKRSTSGTWVRAISVMAAAAVLAAVLVHQKRPAKPALAQIVGQAALRPTETVVPTKLTGAMQMTATKTIRAPRPSKSVEKRLYEPSPASEQELMLAAMASTHPQQLLEVAAMNQRQGDPLKVEPLSTVALRIEPIHIDSITETASE